MVGQADTYHQLGMVAHDQRQYPQGREHLLIALEPWREFNDEYNRNNT